jgi:osmotically-inducible protein OsmY
MKNAKLILSSCACGLLVACGDYSSGDQISTAGNESGEAPNFGSATDVVPSDGLTTSTNNLNVADNGIGGPLQRQSGSFQSQSLPGQSSDEELAKQIRVALTTGSLGTTGSIAEDQLTKIQVRAQGGVVVLSGPVSSEAEKRTIEKQVAGMKGVKAVRNALTVGGRNVDDKPMDPIIPRTPGNQ